MSKIASVVICNSTRQFDREYHYKIPGHLSGIIKPGIRVIVPFGRADRLKEAYVFQLLDSTGMDELKEIRKVVDEKPVLSSQMLSLAAWMKDRYICTYSDVIKCMLPSGIGLNSLRIVKFESGKEGLKPNEKVILDALTDAGNECEYNELQSRTGIKGFSKYLKDLEKAGVISVHEEFSSRIREKTVRVAYLALPVEEVVDEIENNRIKKIQQIRVLEMLAENEYISVTDITRFAGVSGSVLDTLKKYGYIDFRDIEVKRDPLRNVRVEKSEPLKPTVQQKEIIEKVKLHLDNKTFSEFLLHGVTGSGKTEVYLQLIRHVIDMGRQAVVLVPEISLTPQMVERFKGRFGEDVAVLHSRLSLGERYDQWRLIKENRIKVVVGARSAIFAPFDDLGIVIIDEEHENSYKSEITPKYHAAEIAGKRCMQENALLLYGSATPSVERYYQARTGKITLLELNERANRMEMPQVDLVDMRNELNNGNRTIFSRRLKEEMDLNIRAGQQTILFLNRRGYASFVMCRSCGFPVKCLNCNITLTYHAHDDRLICHYCGYTIKTPSVCPKCKSSHIRHFGTGTQKVEEDIRKHFTGASVIRMDMDTTTYKNSHEEILKAFREKNINVMIGTQMIAKGHDFPNVTLVGVLAADSLLNMGDYRASEKTFQLITQVAGRAGRGSLPGRVVIQTYNTEDFSILTACRHDYIAFYDQEIKLREKLDYPPFTNIAVVVLSGVNDRLAFQSAKEFRTELLGLFGRREGSPDVLGPARSPISRIKNKYRWRIVIKCKELDKLISVLREAADGYYKYKEKSTVDLSIDINPVNML